MKKTIHPTYYKKVKVTCACGHTFITGSVVPSMRVEICSNCHPFYTGQQKFIDTEGKVEKFMRLQEEASQVDTASNRKLRKRSGRAAVRKQSETKTKTLKEMIDQVRKP